MNDNPLISIVMPVFNSAKFIHRSIESVLAQTYTNLEIVILDDASSDNSWEIIQQFARRDTRIKAYTIPFVDGPKVARDSAIRKATGGWIVPIDSDDAIEREYVEKLWRRQIETNAEFVGSKMIDVDEKGQRTGGTTPKKDFDYSVVYSGTEAMLRILSYWQFGANGALWKRSVMTNVCPENAYYDFADEYDTRVYLNNCVSVAFVEAEYYYTQNTNSCTRRTTIQSLSYKLFNKIKLKEYFDKRYGRECALSVYYCNCAVEEYIRVFPKLARLCIKSRAKLPDEFVVILAEAYSFFCVKYIKTSYVKVQYYRLLWALVRYKSSESKKVF